MSEFWKTIALMLLGFFRQLLDLPSDQDHQPVAREAVAKAEKQIREAGETS